MDTSNTLLCARLWLAAMFLGLLIGLVKEESGCVKVAFVLGMLLTGGLLIVSFVWPSF